MPRRTQSVEQRIVTMIKEVGLAKVKAVVQTYEAIEAPALKAKLKPIIKGNTIKQSKAEGIKTDFPEDANLYK